MKHSANSNDLYFITFTIVDWVDVFTRVEYKNIVTDILNFYIINKGLEVHSYVIMSNHMHLIARSSEESTLSKFIREFKSYSAKRIFEEINNSPKESRKEFLVSTFRNSENINNRYQNVQLWQNGSHPLILYSNKMIQQKQEYIHNNPVKAGWVDEAWKYWFSSANPNSPVKIIK